MKDVFILWRINFTFAAMTQIGREIIVPMVSLTPLISSHISGENYLIF